MAMTTHDAVNLPAYEPDAGGGYLIERECECGDVVAYCGDLCGDTPSQARAYISSQPCRYEGAGVFARLGRWLKG